MNFLTNPSSPQEEMIKKLETSSTALLDQYSHAKDSGGEQVRLLELRHAYIICEIDLSKLKIKDQLEKQHALINEIELNKKRIENGNLLEVTTN